MQIIGPFWYWPLAIFLCWKSYIFCALMTGYVIYIFFLDNKRHKRPEGSAPIRKLKFWRHLAEYFPAKLIKTGDLDPQRNYIFCAHPHDHLFMACPVWNIRHRRKAGTSVLLIPGGASEALKSQPGHYDLIIKKRKGFVRMALQTGASLVPVMAFGETSLFQIKSPAPGSLVDRIQKLVKRLTGFAIPVLEGDGFWYGAKVLLLLPRCLPVTTVVGAPLHWEGDINNNPSFDAAVDKLHEEYCKALQQIWVDHKDKYAPRAPEGATGRAALTDGRVCFRRKSLDFVA
ncbi:diacylglycerol acyltransferase [Dunaliella salina]|uniref:diacylglycerol O-acyltransferase n=1 Tax=Dunaliella salina TaxID=3046 RepID=A0ABQ7GLF2_DUNSA|nr:diacylglycerol acyltransferase [Dunaliella salina]|eukprot:KAF5835444.1 diacylglycerol acyltransferase [Dunaliella salina]